MKPCPCTKQTSVPQAMVSQHPRYETVISRKLGIRRPTKRKPKVKWI
jgi:hypothetical protein